MSGSEAIRWIMALACESAPIREHFQLRRIEGGPFPVYRSACGRHWLVECGIGRTNAAAAMLHLHHVSAAPAHAAWINVGIAGHEDAPIGSARLVHQVREASTGRTFYPIQVFSTPFEPASLVTVDQVASTLEGGALYDMEGSAVIDFGSRLSSPELVALIKIVSDHGLTPGQYPSKGQVTDWITAHLESLVSLGEGLSALSREEAERTAAPAGLSALLERAHFTVAQRHQAADLMRRWRALEGERSVATVLGSANNAKELLRTLKTHLDGIVIDWGER